MLSGTEVHPWIPSNLSLLMDPDIVSVVQDIQITRFCQRSSNFMDSLAGNALSDTCSSVSASAIVIYDHGEHLCMHLLWNVTPTSCDFRFSAHTWTRSKCDGFIKPHQFDPPTCLPRSIVWYGWVRAHYWCSACIQLLTMSSVKKMVINQVPLHLGKYFLT